MHKLNVRKNGGRTKFRIDIENEIKHSMGQRHIR